MKKIIVLLLLVPMCFVYAGVIMIFMAGWAYTEIRKALA